MITMLILSLNRRWRAIALALLAVVLLPAAAYAVSVSDVVEMFRYTYNVERMIFLGSVETVGYNLLKRKMREQGGRGSIIPYQKQNAGHFVGMGEGGALTSKRAQPATAEATFALKEFQSVVDVTWKMIRAATKSKYAFEKALDFMDTSLKRRVFRIINSQVCSFTGMGELAILTDADDQTTMTVNSLPFVDQGMYVDLIDASNNTTEILSDVIATDVNQRAREVTVSGSAPSGTAAGDFLVPSESVGGGVSHTLNGLGAWISDANPPATVGNLGGINRSTLGNRFYQGNVLENGGVLRAFTEDLLISGENLLRERGGTQADRYMANGNILKRYHGDLIQDRYFNYNKIQPLGAGGEKVGFGREGMDLEGKDTGVGKTQYRLSGKEFHCEPYLRANRILGWADAHFWIAHDGIEVPTVISEVFDGQTPYFHMKSTPAASFDVWGYWEAEVVSDNPQAGIQYQDIAES